MTGRNRPSGMGSNSTRLAKAKNPETGQEVIIPTARASAVAFYVATPDGHWPRRWELLIDQDIAGIAENDVINLEEMRQGRGMGEKTAYRVAERRLTIRRFEGKYGQALREILLVPVASADSLEDLHPSDLDGEL